MIRFELPQTPPGVRLHRVHIRHTALGYDVCECGNVRRPGERCSVGAAQAKASKSARRARRTARRRAEAGVVGTYEI